ncbi:MAG: hypothetical protein M1816_004847 [Peltula sp. TS41687]|nr:MAG: hypothetical protein M1816_004847 [Peltula sp. TS41687]
MHKVFFWTGFGIAVRFWQLGIEMRPFFNKESLWAYPMFGGVGASFGYWLMGVEERQMKILEGRRERLLEKRRRRAERESGSGSGSGKVVEEAGVLASTS